MKSMKALRSLKLIVAEVTLITLGAVALTALPQVTDNPEGARRMVEAFGFAAPVARLLQIDHILGAWWFLGLLALSLASLGLVVKDQWKRFRTQWRENLTAKSFRSCPFRREWTRPAAEPATSLTIRTKGKLGHLGLPLFHTGLLLVVLAGLLRMLFAADAMVDLHEGETLPPSPAAYGAQWPGRFAKPFALAVPLTLDRVLPAHYDNGLLKGLSAQVRLEGNATPTVVAINEPLRFGPRQFYLSQIFGPAAFLEIKTGDQVQQPVALLRNESGSSHTMSISIQDRELKLRSTLQKNGLLGEDVEIRVLRAGALVQTGTLKAGERLIFPDGTIITLADLRYWAQFSASRDAFLPLAYAGFILAIFGAAFIFLLNRVDTAVNVEPCPEGERVWVALRVRRFTPLYEDAFERLVKDNDGPGEPEA
jgi:cytochrome c biogenesis protein ResB